MERALKEAIREVLLERSPTISYNTLVDMTDEIYEDLVKYLAKKAVAKLYGGDVNG